MRERKRLMKFVCMCECVLCRFIGVDLRHSLFASGEEGYVGGSVMILAAHAQLISCSIPDASGYFKRMHAVRVYSYVFGLCGVHTSILMYVYRKKANLV
jgi:hypothetical protein